MEFHYGFFLWFSTNKVFQIENFRGHPLWRMPTPLVFQVLSNFSPYVGSKLLYHAHLKLFNEVPSSRQSK